MRSSDSSVPSVSTASVNEWPAPATRTCSDRATASATSSTVDGCSNLAGVQA